MKKIILILLILLLSLPILSGCEFNPVLPDDPTTDTPTIPENPDQPENPDDKKDPTEDVNPGDKEDPDTPVDPENPGDKEDPDTPVDPENPGDKEDPDTPIDPENPGDKEDPIYNEYHYVVDGWEYFIQPDSTADKTFMKTPYIENVSSTASSTYYASISGLTGSQLASGLKSIISGAKTSYDWSRYEFVDEDSNNMNNIFCIYSRQSLAKTAHVSGNSPNRWNREHSYPQSKMSSPATSDSHIIFADDWKTNGSRGNNPFGVVAHNSSTAVKDSAGNITANWSSGGVFEPCDAAKGEVARSTLYAYVLYGYSVTNNFTSLELCLQWNEQFPPTSWEMLRNNRNYSIQGNRNPFVDHPEFARMILDSSYTGKGALM